jgi:hypothetical protein
LPPILILTAKTAYIFLGGMNLKHLFICIAIVFLSLFLCSCAVDENGADVSAFCARFNRTGDYCLSGSDFFITDEEEFNAMRTYITHPDNSQTLLSLLTDANGEAAGCTVVSAVADAINNPDFLSVCENAIISFCECEEDTAKAVCSALSLLSQESGGVEHICDSAAVENFENFEASILVTDFGTVIAVFRR